MVAYEVEDGEDLGSRKQSKSTPELLQEERRGIRRAKEQDRVDRRDVDTFVQQVGDEDPLQWVIWTSELAVDGLTVLNGLLASTSENLGKIETQLAARSTEFRAAIGHAMEATQLSANELDGQVGKLRDASREIVEGVGTVVKRFEEQSVSLSGATKNLAEGRKSTSDAAQYRFVLGEGDIAGANLRIDKVLLDVKRTAAEGANVIDEREITAN